MTKVKRLTVFLLPANTENKIVQSETEFDMYENETFSVKYFEDGGIEHKVVAKFDEKGKKTEEINYFDENEISEHYYFTRNSAGLVENVKIKYADGSESIKYYKRENNNKQITITTVDDNGDLEEKEILIFDDNENVLERTLFDEDNKQTEKHINTYNDKNQLLHHKEFDADNKLSSEKEYEYNEAGSLLKRITYTPSGKIVDFIMMTYDAQNRPIEHKLGNRYTIKYSYNEAENIQIEERYKPNGVLEHRAELKFDDENRLLEEIMPYGKKVYLYEFYNE